MLLDTSRRGWCSRPRATNPFIAAGNPSSAACAASRLENAAKTHPPEPVIRAFARVRRQEGNEDLRLVLIGDDVGRYASLRRTADEAGVRQEVRFFGFVPHETLAALYRMATVFAFPSLYEGFGLPPLEAMASGTPVVTSNVSSLPEVVGSAAVLVDPHDAHAIAEGIAHVLYDPRLRDDLKRRGLEHAASFSWDRAAREVHAIYAEVAGGRSPS